MTREPTLEAVNRALSVTVQELMVELSKAYEEIARLEAELVAARRSASPILHRLI
jgi:hypothetical protein